MARRTVVPNSNDGYIRSHGGVGSPAGNIAIAQAGTGDKEVSAADTHLWAGQWRSSASFVEVEQSFVEYGHTAVPATELCTSAGVWFSAASTPSGDAWSLEMREKDWGGSLAADDFVPKADIQALSIIAEWPQIRGQRPTPTSWRSGSAALRERLTSATPLRAMFNSNKQWLGYDALGNGDEYVYLQSYESSSSSKVTLEYYSATVSSLLRVAGASVQLSDGTHVYLDNDSGTPTLKHNPSGATYNTIGTLTVGSAANQFALRAGAQVLTLTRDAADNIYVVGCSGADRSAAVVQAFAKGAGYTWTQKTALSLSLPSYDSEINNLAVAWHAIGTTGGFLAIVAAHSQGYGFANSGVFGVASCAAALAGSGAAITATAEMPPAALGAPFILSGNSLDILARTGGAGVIAAKASNSASLKTESGVTLYRYEIGSTGGISTSPAVALSESGSVQTPNDGDTRVKLIPISSSQFVAVNGLVVIRYTQSGTSFTYSYVNFETASIPSLGTSHIQPLDAIYDPATSKIWLVYLDAANSRRVMRTGMSPSSMLRDNTEVQIATNTGASGSSNLAIRLPRGALDARRILVHLGNKTGGGVHSTVTVSDVTLDTAPVAPTLTNPGTFNAAMAKTLSWVFNDLNPGDSQTAYEVEIRVQGTGAAAYASGKVASTSGTAILAGGTLSNGAFYEWRVRTYDEADNTGAWSTYQQFTTTSAGLVEIVVPATDNAPLGSPSLTVEWEFTPGGTEVQASYRVKVVRTDTSAAVFDTGMVSGPAITSYTLTGLLSDVEQRIEVSLEDSNGATSNTATRLVTPDFNQPLAPTVSAQPNAAETGILVSVSNPEPTGDLPDAGRNDIYRSVSGKDAYIKIGEAEPNGSFLDLGAASGIAYDYLAYAVAVGSTPSAVPATATLYFYGVLISNPAIPGHVLSYIYGKANKTDSVSTPATPQRFVGRTYPVYDFGEFADEAVKLSMPIPFSSTHQAEVEALREIVRSQSTHLYRDSRGRKVFGIVAGVNATDEAFGTTIELTVTRSDYSEGVA